MANILDVRVGEALGEPIRLSELLATIHLEQGIQVFHDAARDILLDRLLAREDIEVTDDEIQAEADRFRLEHDLHRAADTEAWLEASGLTQDDFFRGAARMVRVRKLAEQVAEGRVEVFFAGNARLFHAARISCILVEEAELAADLLGRLHDGADFIELARAHSIHPEAKWNGGFMGLVRRSDLSPGVAAALFTGTPGEVVGPVQTDEGFLIFHIIELFRAELTDEVRAEIRGVLFERWLDQQVDDGGLALELVELLRGEDG